MGECYIPPLAKFFDKECYRDAFMAGKLHFSSLKGYADCEDAGRGDSDEGCALVTSSQGPKRFTTELRFRNGSGGVAIVDYSDAPEKWHPPHVQYISPKAYYCSKALCLFAVGVPSALPGKLMLDERMLIEFGQYAVFIPNSSVFVCRALKGIARYRKSDDAVFGLVEYVDDNALGDVALWNPYRKRSGFSYQREARFWFGDDSEESCDIDLGATLDDCAFPLSSDELINHLYVDGERHVCTDL